MVTMSMNELTSELTEDMLMQFKRMNREERIKQTVSLCL